MTRSFKITTFPRRTSTPKTDPPQVGYSRWLLARELALGALRWALVSDRRDIDQLQRFSRKPGSYSTGLKGTGLSWSHPHPRNPAKRMHTGARELSAVGQGQRPRHAYTERPISSSLAISAPQSACRARSRSVPWLQNQSIPPATIPLKNPLAQRSSNAMTNS